MFQAGPLARHLPTSHTNGRHYAPYPNSTQGKSRFFELWSPALPSNSNQPSETHTARERRTGRERHTGRNGARKGAAAGGESTFRGICCCETSGIMFRVITVVAAAQTPYGIRCSSSNLGRSRHARHHIHSRHQHCDTHRQGEAAGGRRRGRRGQQVCAHV